MAGEYLLDTNVLIALFAPEPAIETRFAREATVALSIIALGELFYGAENSRDRATNLARLEAFAAENPVLDCGLETARIFGRLKRDLKAKGRPIPSNDLWIAATAIEHGLILVTHDQHFEAIEGLKLETW